MLCQGQAFLTKKPEKTRFCLAFFIVKINCWFSEKNKCFQKSRISKSGIKEAKLAILLINTLAAHLLIHRTWKLRKNQGYFGWLTNRIAPQRIALESKTLGKSSSLQWKKWFLVLGFRFFVSDVISKVGFWLFLAAGTWPGPNH